MLANAVMLASGALCLGGAVHARSRVAVTAAAVMAVAMTDVVLLHLVPPLVWAVLLVVAGVVLAARLRFVGVVAGTAAVPDEDRGARRFRLERVAARGVVAAAALAYPAAGWLILVHDHAAPAAATSASATAAHLGHLGHDGAPLLAITAGVAVLALVLLALCAVMVARRRGALALEAGAMAAMLLAMLVPGLS